MLRVLLCLMVILAVPVATPAHAGVQTGPTVVCATDGMRNCSPLDLPRPSGEAPDISLQRSVTVTGNPGPVVVRLVAMGSAQVRWNGVIIGQNGVVGDSSGSEQPGRFRAVFAVPPELVRQGENSLTARVTSQHLWLPVRHPVHELTVSGAENLASEELRTYAPALAVGGLLFFAALGFGLVWLMDRSQKGALLLSAVAVVATLQLVIEAGRAFIPYPYPWQLARIAIIATLSAVTAVLMARYTAWRFIPGHRTLVTAVTSVACISVLLLAPGFDAKALGCLVVGIGAVTVCAALGVRSHRASAWKTLIVAGAAGAIALGQGGGFLDSGYYLAIAAVFGALMVEQVRLLKTPDSQGLPPAVPTALSDHPLLRVSDGRRVHLLRLDEIAWLKAADDYCEVGLTDGRVLLNGATLAATLAAAGGRLVRVHRSYAVNPAHITGSEATPGGRRWIMLGAAGNVPIGRVYRTEADRLLDTGLDDAVN